MANEITLYESRGALANTKELNYEILAPNGKTDILVRDVDFGVIPGTSKPSLFQPGAMKIKTLYGFFERHELVYMHIPEPGEQDPYFCFVDKCELIKLHPESGNEYVFQTSYAEASTREKSSGRNPWDGAEACIQKAQKRALVKAVMSVSNLAAMFTMDIEDMNVEKDYKEMLKTLRPDSPVTQEQLKLLYAKAKTAGGSAASLKKTFHDKLGYESTKDIIQRDFNDALALAERKITEEEYLKNKAERDAAANAEKAKGDA